MLHVHPPVFHDHPTDRSICWQLLSDSLHAAQAGQLSSALKDAQAAALAGERSNCPACVRLAVQQLGYLYMQQGDYRQAALSFLRLQQLAETLPDRDVRELSGLSYQLCMVLDQSTQTSRWLLGLHEQLRERLSLHDQQLYAALSGALPNMSAHLGDHPLPASPGQAAPDAARAAPATLSLPVDFEVRCLGQLMVFRHGQQVALPRNRKAELVLKYLVMYRDRPVVRDVLMELGWPGVTPDAAANNLNTTISLLRSTFARALDAPIPGTPIVYEDGAYSLNPALKLAIDVVTFDRWYARGRAAERTGALAEAMAAYQAALDLYGGELLLGDLEDDRTLIERERLASTFLTLLGKLGSYHLEQGHYEEAIDYAHRLLKHDPCREDAHRTLMRSFARLGQRSRALRQYELCQLFLQRELEIEPAAATAQLYQRIARDEEV